MEGTKEDGVCSAHGKSLNPFHVQPQPNVCGWPGVGLLFLPSLSPPLRLRPVADHWVIFKARNFVMLNFIAERYCQHQYFRHYSLVGYGSLVRCPTVDDAAALRPVLFLGLWDPAIVHCWGSLDVHRFFPAREGTHPRPRGDWQPLCLLPCHWFLFLSHPQSDAGQWGPSATGMGVEEVAKLTCRLLISRTFEDVFSDF